MTDESQTFQIVWTLPSGDHINGAGIYSSMEEGDQAASEAIRMGKSPSKTFRVRLRMNLPKEKSPRRYACPEAGPMELAVVGGTYDVATVREFLDFMLYRGVELCRVAKRANDGYLHCTGLKDLNELLSEWQAIKVKAHRERINGLMSAKKNVDDPAQP